MAGASKRRDLHLSSDAHNSLTALVMPIYNEDPVRTTAALQAMAEAYIAFAMEQPSHYRVMFLPEVKASADSEALHASGERAFGLLLERVGRARPKAAGSEREVVAATAWAALHGLALLAIDGTLQHMFAKPDRMLSQACRTITGMVIGGEKNA